MASQSGTTSTPSSFADTAEVVVVATKKIACDGGGGALGHPKVWYDMSEQDFVECKYCDRLFVLKGGSRDPGKSA
jgi:uncharacterized Zn-finger protein